jgi:methionine biosynthesis protein MetW
MTVADRFDSKVETYRRFGNGVVLGLVEGALPQGGRLLDVGCASGGLLAAVDGRAGFRAGIEVSPTAAEHAAAVADDVRVGSLEDPAVASLFPAASFDVVVLADVLEHLAEPGPALARAAAWARPGGTVVVSVPNIGYWAARWQLARGRFPQEDSGIFDETHLRFFTVELVGRTLREAGLDGVSVRPVVPALRNHVGVTARFPRLERVWQRAGAARPGLMGFQLVGTGQVSIRA